MHRNIFTRFGIPRVLISDEGSHFVNKVMATLLAKYNVKHKVSTAYHPQTNGQAKVSNREMKSILKKVVNTNRRDWSFKLDDALWKREHFWAVKQLNMDLTTAREVKKHQLLELDEFRREAYKNAKIYKEKTKVWHDRKIKQRTFEPGQRVLLFNSRLKLFLGKLKSRWSSSFTVMLVYPQGVIIVRGDNSEREFTVNGQRLKHYWGEEMLRQMDTHQPKTA
ncbi:uncharacterized protein LOC111021814 [Momordica charantia]|uniref:Uncharacterized protein LOC111021814 n=1 Tax=Momordica charantia TaxID=3673 RepID=A0A6J1DM25_MOMCH|nr:uncharacterized protein LOC111021814 [Momordica charantia]